MSLPRHPPPARRGGVLAALGLALLLGACASLQPATPPAPPPASPPPAAPADSPAPPPPATAETPATTPRPSPRTAAAEALAIEQRWLQDWFRGTPVRIALRSDGELAVEVPREFCFDADRSQVKPALAAVLDKVAESLRRRNGTRLTLLSAPADAAGGAAATALAVQRATAVQRHLRERGIAASRLGEPVADGVAAVSLRIGSAPR